MSGLVILLDEGLLNYRDLKCAFSHLNNNIIANYLINGKKHDLDIYTNAKDEN